MSSRTQIAQALAGGQTSPPQFLNPAQYDSQGLQQPPEALILQNLGHAASGYMAGQLGTKIAQALAAKALPALQGLGEAGAIFPAETPPDQLPVIPSGSKTGEPHALYAYHDNYGPGMTSRAQFNVFGDPAHDLFTSKKIGYGATVGNDVLEKLGIPIVGREAPRSFLQKGFK